MVYLAESSKEISQANLHNALVNEQNTIENAEHLPAEEIQSNIVNFPLEWSLLDSLPVGVLVLDNKGIVVFANSESRRIMEENVESLSWLSVIERFFTPKGDDGFDLTLINGKRVKLNTRPFNNGKSQLISLIDISDTRSYQDKINHEERIYQMGQMASNLAHQIRTPLSSAMIYSNLLSLEKEKEIDNERYKSKIIAGLRQIECQIKDVLLFSRRETLLDESVNLRTLLKALKTEYLETRGESTAIDIQVKGDCADFDIKGNSSALLGAFSNLINNAIEASKSDCLVRISLCRDGNEIKVSIDDNGPGVADEQLKKMLEPFYTTKSTGTGLGLPVVKSVITAHGGTINLARSEMGGLSINMEFQHD